MKKESFSTYETAWCPGCGNFVILECLKEALETIGAKISKGINGLPRYWASGKTPNI